MSSLSDFELDNEETIEKIKNEYVIIPEEDLFFADIFEQISNNACAQKKI